MGNSRDHNPPVYNVPSAVLRCQREEIAAMMYALTKALQMGGVDPDSGVDDPELAPLIPTIPHETLNALTVPMGYFGMETLSILESENVDISPTATLIRFGMKIADIAHRCGVLHGVAIAGQGVPGAGPEPEQENE